MSVTGMIADISRGSLHDGPGVRTVVYFKGCALRCSWCHNPETLSAEPEVLFAPSKCIHCGKCVELCPQHHVIKGNDMVFLRSGCTACGKCVQACPAAALRLCGEEKTAEELFSLIKKDAPYYRYSGGGVTFSGGECLLQPQMVARLAKMCKEHEINTAVETALYVPWENVEAVLEHIDLFYVDMKLPNAEKYLEFTGGRQSVILENLQKLSARRKNIVVRIPVIPGVNDADVDLDGFGLILRGIGGKIKQVELLKYNHLAESKYTMTDRPYMKFAENCQTDPEMERICAYLKQKSGIECSFAK